MLKTNVVNFWGVDLEKINKYIFLYQNNIFIIRKT